MNVAVHRENLKSVAQAIRNSKLNAKNAEYEIARYYVGVMISMANEANVMVGHVISRGTLSTDFGVSSSRCIYDGKEKALNEISFGKKLMILADIAKKIGVEKSLDNRLSVLRNLSAHAVIVESEDGKMLFWDEYDINAAFNNDIETKLDDFFDEIVALESYCKKIEERMDSTVNMKNSL